jgi:hypothetical protein
MVATCPDCGSASPQPLREALAGRVTVHHRFMFQLDPQYIDFA